MIGWLVVGAGACAEAPPVAPGDARSVVTAANAEIHALHLEALALPAWPASGVRACAEGGEVQMMTEVGPSTEIEALRHAFAGCATAGWQFDGTIDYLSISFCPDDKPSFTITGAIVLDGRDPCSVAATETCGVIAGEACGARL